MEDAFSTYSTIYDVKTGKVVVLGPMTMRCSKCNAFMLGAVFQAVASDNIRVDMNTGEMERLFWYVGESPLCDCDQGIWVKQPTLDR